MRVLIACEYSGAVRDAFTRGGHDAMSCDLLPAETPGQHYQGDVRDVLDYPWDLMIAHPPCTHLSVSGGSGGKPVETMSLNFTKIKWEITAQKSEGTQQGTSSSVWDMALNKKGS